LIYGLRPLSGLIEYTQEGYSRHSEPEPERPRRGGCCDFFSRLPSRIWEYCRGQPSESSQPLLIN